MKIYDEKHLTESLNINEKLTDISNKLNNHYNGIIRKMLHELKNPLTLIYSTVQLIETNQPEIKELKYWSQLLTDLNEYMDLLKTFSKIGNFLELSINNNNLLSLITRVTNSFIPLSKLKNISLSLTIDDDSKSYLTNYPFDKIKLKQVFTNLIKNAIEATDPGGYVRVDCYVQDKIFIAVHDNGRPISKENLAYIFEPFITTKANGTGLGLPISKSIVLSHMGNIEVQSTKEKTSFIVSFPLL